VRIGWLKHHWSWISQLGPAGHGAVAHIARIECWLHAGAEHDVQKQDIRQVVFD
jgi:hypothetical protein